MTDRDRSRVRGEAGSAVLEAVLVVPVVMVLLLAVVQFALWAHAAQVVHLAASEGDRAARVLGGTPTTGAAAADAVVHGPGSDVTSSDVVADVMPGGVARVRVTGMATTVLPGLSLPVSATVVGPIQTFRTSG